MPEIAAGLAMHEKGAALQQFDALVRFFNALVEFLLSKFRERFEDGFYEHSAMSHLRQAS
jgi:hypothetical protein